MALRCTACQILTFEVMKTREKEIYSLEPKSDNQLQTIKNLKELSNNLKNYNSKFEKSLKRIENKRIKKDKKGQVI